MLAFKYKLLSLEREVLSIILTCLPEHVTGDIGWALFGFREDRETIH